MKGLHYATFTLLIIGGINWLLEAFGWGIGSWVAAEWWGTLMVIVYVLVGLSAIYELFSHKSNCQVCAGGSSEKAMPGGGMENAQNNMNEQG